MSKSQNSHLLKTTGCDFSRIPLILVCVMESHLCKNMILLAS